MDNEIHQRLFLRLPISFVQKKNILLPWCK